jgi:hypothetical protein
MNEFEKFIKKENERKANINQIANALKSNFEPKNAEKILPDGTKQMVTKSFNPFGKEIYTASKDGKNVMTFSNKKQLLDYLGEN